MDPLWILSVMCHTRFGVSDSNWNCHCTFSWLWIYCPFFLNFISVCINASVCLMIVKILLYHERHFQPSLRRLLENEEISKGEDNKNRTRNSYDSYERTAMNCSVMERLFFDMIRFDQLTVVWRLFDKLWSTLMPAWQMLAPRKGGTNIAAS